MTRKNERHFDPWERIDVSSWPVRQTEQGGSEGAQWLVDPDENRWLHKNVEVKGSNRQGEDWAEVMTTAVAELLGIPAARTRLCRRDGIDGSLSLSIRPELFDLWSGGELLLDTFPETGYIPGIRSRDGVTRPGHSLKRIRDALRRTSPPEGAPAACIDGFDCFVGYLVLDAIVANRDRHEENWAVLMPRVGAGKPVLAPSFDHGSALGFGERDELRDSLIRDEQRLHAWVARGTAWRIEHVENPVSLVDLAADALGHAGRSARAHWHSVIKNADLSPLTETVSQLTERIVSYPSRNFALAIIETNLRRIEDEFNRRYP